MTQAELRYERLLRGPRSWGLHPEQTHAYWKELIRTDARRRFPDIDRYVRERDAVLRVAFASLRRSGRAAEGFPTLARFPWTYDFRDEDHCLGDLAVRFVEIPSEAPCALRGHKVCGRDLDRQGHILVYSASWAMQHGCHPHATYEGRPISYFDFSPTYIRINARNVRTLVEGIQTARIISVVVPSVGEAERKLIEFAHAELDDFCHPMFTSSAREWFEHRYRDSDGNPVLNDEIRRRFSRLVLVGYSFGCTVMLQHLRWTAKEMRSCGFEEDVIRDAFSVILCVLIGPNIDFEHTLAPTIAVRSPLDAVITGHEELGLCSTVRNDRSSELFEEEELEHMMRGEYGLIHRQRAPLWLTDNTVQFNFALPGIVGFDEKGERLHPFTGTKHGHDVKQYIAAMRENPSICDAIAFALSNEPAVPLDLRKIFDLGRQGPTKTRALQ